MNLVKLNGKEIKSLEDRLSVIKQSKEFEENIELMLELLELEDDEKTFEELQNNLKEFDEFLEENTLATLLSGEYDDNNAIMSIHAGAGGRRKTSLN